MRLRLLAVSAGVLIGLAVAGPAHAHCTFRLDRERALPGGTFHGIGEAMHPGELVDIHWRSVDGPVLARSVVVAPDGTFRQELRVPGDAIPGYYVVVAKPVSQSYHLGAGLWVDDSGAPPPSGGGTTSQPPPPPSGHEPSPAREPAPARQPARQPATEPATQPVRHPATVPAPAPATAPVSDPATAPAPAPAAAPVTVPSWEASGAWDPAPGTASAAVNPAPGPASRAARDGLIARSGPRRIEALLAALDAPTSSLLTALLAVAMALVVVRRRPAPKPRG